MSLGKLNFATLSLCCLAILVCQAGSSSAFDRLKQAAGATDQVDEARLRGDLAKAVRENPDLRGSWARITIEEDKSMRVGLVVDSDSVVGARQEKLLRELVKQYAGSNFDNFEKQTERLPIGAILARIVTETEDDSKLAGVRVLNAHFYPREGQPGQLFLKLNGSISNVDQSEILRKLVNEKLVPEFLGEQAAMLIVDTDPATSSADSDVGMVVRPLSTGAASMCFETGMEAFIQQDYNKALTYLNCAVQNDPKRDEIKYWRVATLIALKQNDRAEEIVKKLTPANRVRVPYFSARVLSSLERINGPIRTPIRQQLDFMVRQAICCQ